MFDSILGRFFNRKKRQSPKLDEILEALESVIGERQERQINLAALKREVEQQKQALIEIEASMSVLSFYEEFGRYLHGKNLAEEQCVAAILQLASAVSPDHREIVEGAINSLKEPELNQEVRL